MFQKYKYRSWEKYWSTNKSNNPLWHRCTQSCQNQVFLYILSLFNTFAMITCRPLIETPGRRHMRSGHPGNLLEDCKRGLSQWTDQGCCLRGKGPGQDLNGGMWENTKKAGNGLSSGRPFLSATSLWYRGLTSILKLIGFVEVESCSSCIKRDVP